jgi:hypothetical protein
MADIYFRNGKLIVTTLRNHNMLWFFFLDAQAVLHYTFPVIQNIHRQVER